MLLALLLPALAEPFVSGQKAIGIIEGSVGIPVWLTGYVGFGLAEYTTQPPLYHGNYALVMGMGGVMMVDGWARFGSAIRLNRSQDLSFEEGKSHFWHRVAIADFSMAGFTGLLGTTCLLWSVKLESLDTQDSRAARNTGAALLGSALVAGGLGALQWHLGGANTQLSVLPDGTVMMGVQGTW